MLLGPEKSLADAQSQMNRSTRGQWDWYASHRAAIERLIVPWRPDLSICVLGAGNCNDLDLKWLSQTYAKVELVDIDRSALERAIKRQAVQREIQVRAPIDLSGIADQTRGWKGSHVSSQQVDRAIATVTTDPRIDETFDLVLSPCVLSQLLCGVRDVLGARHHDWPRLKEALRRRHLRTMTRMLKPGGRGVLIVDLSSTKILPGLDQAREEQLPDLFSMCIKERRCFRGLEPSELRALLPRAAQTEVSAPWLWHLGWGKAFLCYAMTLRSPESTSSGCTASTGTGVVVDLRLRRSERSSNKL
jgi:hypothetical protein